MNTSWNFYSSCKSQVAWQQCSNQREGPYSSTCFLFWKKSKKVCVPGTWQAKGEWQMMKKETKNSCWQYWNNSLSEMPEPLHALSSRLISLTFFFITDSIAINNLYIFHLCIYKYGMIIHRFRVIGKRIYAFVNLTGIVKNVSQWKLNNSYSHQQYMSVCFCFYLFLYSFSEVCVCWHCSISLT